MAWLDTSQQSGIKVTVFVVWYVLSLVVLGGTDLGDAG